MGEWLGRNWQLLDEDDQQALIGLTYGIGLLDENVEATGTLAIALAALRAELARPVDLGGGVTVVPEVRVELGTDTATLSLRGSVAGISAAWRRLPELFTSGTVTASTVALRPEVSAWPADLVRRTGHTAAALAWLKATAPDAHARAGVLLARLNPLSQLVAAVFFTTEESLIGLAFPVVPDGVPPIHSGWHDGRPAPPTRWAGGTGMRNASERASELSEGLRSDTSSRLDDSLGRAPTSDSRVMFSVLVPRSESGLRAAELLGRQLSAVAVNTIGYQEGMLLEVCGVGGAYCVVVLSASVIQGPARDELLRAARLALGLIPDAWLGDALRWAALPSAARIERERMLMGLAADEAPSEGLLRASINAAVESLELNFIPAAAGLDNVKQAEYAAFEQGRSQVFRSRVGRITVAARLESWEPAAPPSWTSSLLVGQRSIRLGGFQPGHGRRDPVTEGVVTSHAVAVLEDQAGTLVVVDDQLRTLTVQPALFHRHGNLRQLLAERLADVPRLSYNSGVDRKKLQDLIRRRRLATTWPFAAAAAVAAIVITANVMNNSSNHAVTERVRMDETVTLHNGTTITVWGLDASPGIADGPLDGATVQVKFCAGGDTKARNLPPETQRRVSPGNFMAFNEGDGYARLAGSEKQLPEATLREGECTTGELVFTAAELDSPRTVYKNELGDDVVWYPYGERPKK